MTHKRSKRQRQASFLRTVRKVHRYTGVALFVLFMIVGVTGLLLGWKKNSGGYLLPESQRGTARQLADWQALALLEARALHLLDSLAPQLDPAINRIDVRPDKGMVKFTFKEHYYELQLDGATGQLLSFRKRRSDLLEQIHDGSIVDKLTGWSFFKLLYTSIMGLALLVFTLTGFWLWYGPIRMRKM
ncbi:MAG: PepSY domain-containing protein [Bacteroidetes bacterium]|nr:MAG: PepSY domain-containing protein [Bacteroidota bacterium]